MFMFETNSKQRFDLLKSRRLVVKLRKARILAGNCSQQFVQKERYREKALLYLTRYRGNSFSDCANSFLRTTDLYLSTKGSVVSKLPVIVSLAGRVSSAQFGNLVDFGFTLKAECGKFHGN
ncbi:unnamed protein product [Heterotrigona itama]|uniref:Uncharacterized protein n=1 Tax=Heterotrigona itama TaxID=395501 RepID=A0A6V7HH18_9HYME|nr:unnamed protein product [Heterotrigona itama]